MLRFARSDPPRKTKNISSSGREESTGGKAVSGGKREQVEPTASHIARTHSESRQAGLPAQGFVSLTFPSDPLQADSGLLSETLVGTCPPPITAARPRWNPRSLGINAGSGHHTSLFTRAISTQLARAPIDMAGSISGHQPGSRTILQKYAHNSLKIVSFLAACQPKCQLNVAV